MRSVTKDRQYILTMNQSNKNYHVLLRIWERHLFPQKRAPEGTNSIKRTSERSDQAFPGEGLDGD